MGFVPPRLLCSTEPAEQPGMVLLLILQQILVVHNLHGQLSSDQRAEDRLRGADHDPLFLPAVGIVSVCADEKVVDCRVVGRKVFPHLLDGDGEHVKLFTDLKHPVQPDTASVLTDALPYLGPYEMCIKYILTFSLWFLPFRNMFKIQYKD